MLKCLRYRLIPIMVCLVFAARNAQACCAVAAEGVPVVNADQTVIIWWDKANQREHFIRKASFRGGGESIGFLVPTPSRPQLEESGNLAFRHLAEITAPKAPVGGGFPLGCSVAPPAQEMRGVRLIEEKTVAGFDAVVLAADSGRELVEWLRQRGYAFTPEAAAWAQPYLTDGWHITAMKVTKDKQARAKSEVSAAALRISFKTDRPIFPYREPDSRSDASQLGIAHRLLRIYFVAESRYEGRFSPEHKWSGKARYSQPLQKHQRTDLLRHLNLPESTAPTQAWLTEFEDAWPYGKAPGDVYFSPSADQGKLTRDLSSARQSSDPTLVALIGVFLARPLFRRRKIR